ncbi:NAD-dependent epimerase/dehydratase family protein [Pseudomonas aeruginosa]
MVTGATGFIGAALVNSLCSSGQYKVWAGCRRRGGAWPRGVTPCFWVNWAVLLSGMRSRPSIRWFIALPACMS